ncbi:UNVERIFIED_CONTAM: hypothetical protein FKN15_061131 [Acipenser sinensis]
MERKAGSFPSDSVWKRHRGRSKNKEDTLCWSISATQLIRMVLRQSFEMLKRGSWDERCFFLQEELAAVISQLIHSLQKSDAQYLFLETFLQTMNREWNGIDRLRLDKFYKLIRMVLRQSFEMLKRGSWDERCFFLQEELAAVISQLIHSLQKSDAQYLFLETFLQTMNREWNGIDRLRLDKFYKLIRMVLRQSFEMLKRGSWDERCFFLQEELAAVISQLIHSLQKSDAQYLFLETFLQTMNREWNGIDRLRLDKFYKVLLHMLHELKIVQITNRAVIMSTFTSLPLTDKM